MQDRFKFRAWTGTQMLSDAAACNGVYARADWSECNDFILMQCTGLKDKNGKLIYEGDIVKDDREALHYVRWVYDSWQLFPCTQNNYTIGIVDDEIEVIGNIYENKELLNE